MTLLSRISHGSKSSLLYRSSLLTSKLKHHFQSLASPSSSSYSLSSSLVSSSLVSSSLVSSSLVSSSLVSVSVRWYTSLGNRKFVDKVVVEAKGGKGGNGCMSYEVLSPSKRRPNGGNGGQGGSVYVIADKNLVDLTFETYHFNGGDGNHGGSEGRTGRRGKDVYIRVPVGTIVTERITNNSYYDIGDEEEGSITWDEDEDNESEEAMDDEDELRNAGDVDDDQDENDLDDIEYNEEDIDMREQDEAMSFDLDQDGMILLAAKGGPAGIGNGTISGMGRVMRRSAPKTKMPGQAGQSRSLLLELKIIADVGLVGYPNAGKSSLLAALSNATPKVDNYPFTTLNPSVGIVEYSDLERITVADIPGLVEGAHENRGLGHEFLRHIERTKVLLFVVDATGLQERAPHQDLKSLLVELQLYDESLLKKPSLVFANKTDLLAGNWNSLIALRKFASSQKLSLLPGSTSSGQGLGELANRLRELVDAQKQTEKQAASRSQATKEETPEPTSDPVPKQRVVDSKVFAGNDRRRRRKM